MLLTCCCKVWDVLLQSPPQTERCFRLKINLEDLSNSQIIPSTICFCEFPFPVPMVLIRNCFLPLTDFAFFSYFTFLWIQLSSKFVCYHPAHSEIDHGSSKSDYQHFLAFSFRRINILLNTTIHLYVSMQIIQRGFSTLQSYSELQTAMLTIHLSSM